jgi:hypothetical protein
MNVWLSHVIKLTCEVKKYLFGAGNWIARRFSDLIRSNVYFHYGAAVNLKISFVNDWGWAVVGRGFLFSFFF